MRKLMAAAAVALLGAVPVAGPYPPTPRIPVVERAFGTAYVDRYRWLEDDGAPAVKRWAAAQRRYALRYLTAQAGYAPLRARIAALSKTSAHRFDLQIRRGRWVYQRLTPPQAQPQLVARDGRSGAERVLYDPLAAAHGAPPAAIESVYESADGTKVAFTTQSGGSEEETLHVVDAADATPLADTIPHAGGGVSPNALAWDADGGGFTYTRYPQDVAPALRHFDVRLYHHRLGTDPATDRYVFGRGQSKVAEYALVRSPDGKRLAAFVEPGDLGDYAVWVRDGDGPFVPVAALADHVKDGAFLGSTLLLRSSKRHPTYDVYALRPGETLATAPVFLPARAMPVERLAVSGERVFAELLDAGESVVRAYDARGESRGAVPFPPHVALTAAGMDPAGGGDIVFGYRSYGTPDRWVRYDADANAVVPTGIGTEPSGDYSKLVVTRVFVPAWDGTAKIPLTVVRLPGARRDGSAPTILTAYGGYGLDSTPFFLGSSLAWLERGGVFAQANVRGGGEYGAAWHLAAVHATKTKTADDLGACARWLETHGYGDARHLGIVGGSDGGFLMGMAITRNPSLYRAVVGEVGIYDIPAWQRSPNGASNIPEFGDARKAADFAYIMKQSPYQNVRDGVPYPAMLMTTGENDPRVSPLNSRKMTARLQAASSSGQPVLLIQTGGEGHGIGSSFQQAVDERVWTTAFFAAQLGLRAAP